MVVVIIAQDGEDLECVLKRLNKAYKEWCLTINFDKTEFIAINTDQEFHISIEENFSIKQVQKLEIFGCWCKQKGYDFRRHC